MSWPAPTWTFQEKHVAGANGYEVNVSANVTAVEAQRFYTQWLFVAGSLTAGATITLDPMDGAGNIKIRLYAFDTDPEDCHEDLIDDIKTVEDVLETADTQVTQANSTEIAAYASGKIVATVGTP